MPNPFPGMNPYLEDPKHWRDVHGALIYEFRRELSDGLPSGFAAFVEERVYVQETMQSYIADALVIETLSPARPNEAGSEAGGVATQTRPALQAIDFDAPRKLSLVRTREKERFIEVRTGNDFDELIAVIEFLSPTNKTTVTGRRKYKQKQDTLLQSGAHLLEIDLLRGGAYTIAPPEKGTRQQLGTFDYVISLHRAFAGDTYEIWPVMLRERLPRLCLPLANEQSVVVDLQKVLKQTYEHGRYEKRIDYSRPANPPLEPGDVSWANDQIAAMQTGTSDIINTTINEEVNEATSELAETNAHTDADLETKDF